MKTDSMLLFFYTESPLHAGTGSTLSHIDLPIQRETHNQHPVVYGSSVKGALREQAADRNGKLERRYQALFGPEDANDHSGLGIFQEARVALFPVACFDGVFRWITCPLALHRLWRDLQAVNLYLAEKAKAAADEFLKIPLGTVNSLQIEEAAGAGDRLCFGDLEFRAKEAATAKLLGNWFASHAFPRGAAYDYWRKKAETSLVVLNDEPYTHLVKTATHIEMHVKIGDDGTVAQGPWAEESLPCESLLYSSIVVPEALDGKIGEKLTTNGQKETGAEVLRGLQKKVPRFQMGGGRTSGMGWVSTRLMGEDS